MKEITVFDKTIYVYVNNNIVDSPRIRSIFSFKYFDDERRILNITISTYHHDTSSKFVARETVGFYLITYGWVAERVMILPYASICYSLLPIQSSNG